jgi:nicotinamide-nucleotide amidase
VRTIEAAWHPFVFGRGDDTLPIALGNLLRSQNKTLATAESCTGGWLGKLIVDVPGSSEYYRGGWVTYSNDMKQSQLGVSETLLRVHGAVSREVAAAMAEGALRRGNSDVAISITGVAGPDGGSAEKPVGLVYIGLARKSGDQVANSVRRFRFTADRMSIRDRSAKAALQLLRFALLNVVDDIRLLWEVRENSAGDSR